MLSPDAISRKYGQLKQDAANRDHRMLEITEMRGGTVPQAYQHLVSEQFPEPVVANFIDVAARDLAESTADLPAFSCSSSNMTTDAGKRKADKFDV